MRDNIGLLVQAEQDQNSIRTKIESYQNHSGITTGSYQDLDSILSES